ncbi:hypothetical protein NECAME_18963, partial [Necator americanus]
RPHDGVHERHTRPRARAHDRARHGGRRRHALRPAPSRARRAAPDRRRGAGLRRGDGHPLPCKRARDRAVRPRVAALFGAGAARPRRTVAAGRARRGRRRARALVGHAACAPRLHRLPHRLLRRHAARPDRPHARRHWRVRSRDGLRARPERAHLQGACRAARLSRDLFRRAARTRRGRAHRVRGPRAQDTARRPLCQARRRRRLATRAALPRHRDVRDRQHARDLRRHARVHPAHCAAANRRAALGARKLAADGQPLRRVAPLHCARSAAAPGRRLVARARDRRGQPRALARQGTRLRRSGRPVRADRAAPRHAQALQSPLVDVQRTLHAGLARLGRLRDRARRLGAAVRVPRRAVFAKPLVAIRLPQPRPARTARHARRRRVRRCARAV